MKKLYRRVFFLSAFLFVAIGYCGTALAADTYVSLTFDDGRASQVNAAYLLANHGMNGTFYLISSELGTSDYYMSLSDVQGIASAGNDIGGHTRSHMDLTLLSTEEVEDQVCSDQEQLKAWGFNPLSFAYPYGHSNSAVREVISSCKQRGYNVDNYLSARGVGGLQCPTCYSAESLPPVNPFFLRTPPSMNIDTLDELKTAVINAEATGGWLVIPFHSICNAPGSAPIPGDAGDCIDLYSISYDDLDQFMQWLSARPNTNVETVTEVMQIPLSPPPSPIGPNLVLNPSLELDLDLNNKPDGYLLTGYGTNIFSYARLNTDAHTGTYSEQLTVSELSSGDRKVATSQDLGVTTLPAKDDESYEAGVWYKSDVPVLIVGYYHDIDGWHYWNESPYAPASDSWTQLRWRTPLVQAGWDYWSFGLTLTQTGTFVVDDYSAVMITDGCDSTMPSLRLSKSDVRWDSYADFLDQTLTVDFVLNNTSTQTAYNTQINDARSTAGVICITPMPTLLGHIDAGTSRTFSMKYLVPIGVGHFSTMLETTSQNACGETVRLSG